MPQLTSIEWVAQIYQTMASDDLVVSSEAKKVLSF